MQQGILNILSFISGMKGNTNIFFVVRHQKWLLDTNLILINAA